ncbi:hypothetical protein LI148_18950, partial [Colidextribacter sp. 210702-DFI.3.9]|nr:hypothetical protein [Colidextribacter sp. 210702-DFI.3.9]
SETNEKPFILSNQVCVCYSTVNNLPAVARRIFDTWADGMTAPSLTYTDSSLMIMTQQDSLAFSRRRIHAKKHVGEH